MQPKESEYDPVGHEQPVKGFQKGNEVMRYSFERDGSDSDREDVVEEWCHDIQVRDLPGLSGEPDVS